MTTQVIQKEVVDGVLVIKLDRPEARNAINRQLALEISDAVHELDERPDLSVGILASTSQTFCAGMDLKGFLAGESPIIDGKGLAGITEQPPRKPLIAAVDGAAVAGGFELALACDLIIASVDAFFGLPEVKRGLIAGAGGVMRLPDRIPPNLAMEIILSGEPLGADRAYEVGLVNRLCDSDSLPTAIDLATSIARNAPLAVAGSKRIAVESRGWSSEEAMEKQQAIINPILASHDAREGAAAFAQKRLPIWLGK
ncbi:MAG: crotonase/enoyl-CoA hydratase family protein [Pseudomonadota bacterium]